MSRFPMVACHASTTPHLTGCKLYNTQCVSTKIASDHLCERNNDIVKSKGIGLKANIGAGNNCINIVKGVNHPVHGHVAHEKNHVKDNGVKINENRHVKGNDVDIIFKWDNLYTISMFHRDLMVLNAMTILSQKTLEVLFTTMTHLQVKQLDWG